MFKQQKTLKGLLPAMSLALLSSLVFSQSQAQQRGKLPSDATLERVQTFNEEASRRGLLLRASDHQNVLRPFADHEPVGLLFFSTEDMLNSRQIKETLLKNLPEGVKAVGVVANPAPTAWEYFKNFATFFDLSRFVQVDVNHRGNTSFWIRDSVPIPVHMSHGGVGAVDAKYFHHFNPDKDIAAKFQLDLISFDAYNEGGNFLADTKGRCFIVNNSRIQSVTDEMFRQSYGCSSVHRFPHLRGIGHIDERLKFISDELALTDEPSYAETLERLGIRTKILPRPEGLYTTYANSVTVNGVVFLPVFDQPTDAAAIQIFEQAGLKVIPIVSKDLPEQKQGNIHCMTMTYPQVPLRDRPLALPAQNINPDPTIVIGI